MSKKMMGYVNDALESRLRAIVLHIGKTCNTEGYGVCGREPPSWASKNEIDLLEGSAIIEKGFKDAYFLTKERGEEVYRLLTEELKKSNVKKYVDKKLVKEYDELSTRIRKP